MSGPIIIAIFGLAIFLLVKYRVQVKNSFASMSTAIPTSTSNGNNEAFFIDAMARARLEPSSGRSESD